MKVKTRLRLAGFDRNEIIGEPGREIPEGWLVFNAPRDLYSTLPTEANQWEGEFFNGRNYAMVDPAEGRAQDWIDFNRSQKAIIVEFVPLAVHRARVEEWSIEKAIPTLQPEWQAEIVNWDFPMAMWDRSYRSAAMTNEGVAIWGQLLIGGSDFLKGSKEVPDEGA